jgi:serine protease DegS
MAGKFKRSAVFLAGSILAGLVLAALAAILWPQLIRPPVVMVPVAEAPMVQATTVTASTSTTNVPAVPVVVAPISETALTTPLERATSGSFADAVRASAPAVVNVYARRTVTERDPNIGLEQLLGGPLQPRFRERVQTSLGSGVIVDREGHIVTNQHVIANFDQISAQLADGRVASVKVVGSDPDTDLAVLKIDLPRLPVMPLGRSDLMQVGDVVLAIGSPLGLSQTVTHGIVSATGRAQLGVATFENFIQTDAAINIGNSGGALVNTRGELIGINTAVLGKNIGAEGIGVAIPVDLVRGVMREILQHGRVIRGWIGIVPDDIGPEHVRQLNLPHAGVVVNNLYRDSPALQAGLTRGDMIESVDGRPVRNAQDTLAQIARRKPGTSVTLVGMRGNQRFTMQLKVVEPPRQTTK